MTPCLYPLIMSLVGPAVFDTLLTVKLHLDQENERRKGVSNVGNHSVKTNDRWQDVGRLNRNGVGTIRNEGKQYNGNEFGYRGWYNGSGRGSFNGRGGMNGRGGVYQRGGNVGVGRENITESNKGSGQNLCSKNVMNVKNSFSVLSDETVEIGGDEWVQMKGKINLACDLGMHIGESVKCRWRISKMQKDISFGHTNVSKVANEEAEKECVVLMKKEGITLNQAFLKVYDEKYKLKWMI
ncbi:hypothetical protein Tco_0139236 [Tanacetum coccineum]